MKPQGRRGIVERLTVEDSVPVTGAAGSLTVRPEYAHTPVRVRHPIVRLPPYPHRCFTLLSASIGHVDRSKPMLS